jgi:hypothetical protein
LPDLRERIARKGDVELRGHCERDVLLHGQYVDKILIVRLGQQMKAGDCIDQLSRHPHPVAGTPDASLQNRTDIELACNGCDVHVLSLERERGGSRGNPQNIDVRERIQQLLRQSVREVILAGVPAHVRERQDRHGVSRWPKLRRCAAWRGNAAREPCGWRGVGSTLRSCEVGDSKVTEDDYGYRHYRQERR